MIIAGGENAELFRNRKGYFSLNVQTVCNSNLEITNVVARWQGSVHDSTIFNNSRLRANFEDGTYGNSLLLEDCLSFKAVSCNSIAKSTNCCRATLQRVTYSYKKYNRALVWCLEKKISNTSTWDAIPFT